MFKPGLALISRVYTTGLDLARIKSWSDLGNMHHVHTVFLIDGIGEPKFYDIIHKILGTRLQTRPALSGNANMEPTDYTILSPTLVRTR